MRPLVRYLFYHTTSASQACQHASAFGLRLSARRLQRLVGTPASQACQPVVPECRPERRTHCPGQRCLMRGRARTERKRAESEAGEAGRSVADKRSPSGLSMLTNDRRECADKPAKQACWRVSASAALSWRVLFRGSRFSWRSRVVCRIASCGRRRRAGVSRCRSWSRA
jgi:hypothetical protein